MKLNALLLLFVFSVQSVFATCQVAFTNPRKLSTWLKMDVSRNSISKLRKFAANAPIDQKFGLYEQIINTLNERVEFARAQIKIQMKRIERKKGKEQASAYVDYTFNELAQEFKRINDFIIDDLSRELTKKGIKNQVKYQLANDTQPKIYNKYLEIQPAADSSSYSSKVLARYQRQFDLKNITVNLWQNSMQRSLGFFHPVDRRLEIGTSGLKSILIDDLPIAVVKHEGKHAGFEVNRIKNGEPSIYDFSYQVMGDIENLTGRSLYARFMSAEELYNWAHDPFWNTKRFSNIKEYQINSIINDVNDSLYKLYGTEAIAAQTEMLADDFVRYFKQIKNDIDGALPNIFPLSAQLELANKIDEVKYLLIRDPELQIGIRVHIPQHLKEDLKQVLNLDINLNQNLDRIAKDNGRASARDFSETELKELRKYMRSEFAKMGLNAEPNYHRIVDFVIDQQSKLKQKATAVKQESKILQQYMDKFVDDFNRASTVHKREFLFTPEWQERFKQLRIRYKKYADLTAP